MGVAPRKDSYSSAEGDDISPHITLFPRGGCEKDAGALGLAVKLAGSSFPAKPAVSVSTYRSNANGMHSDHDPGTAAGSEGDSNKAPQAKVEDGVFSYGAFAEANRGTTTRAVRLAAVSRWREGEGTSATRRKVEAKAQGSNQQAFRQGKCLSFGEWRRQNRGATREERQAALRQFYAATGSLGPGQGVSRVTAIQKQCTQHEQKKHRQEEKPKEGGTFSYGEYLRQNPGATRAERRAAIARFYASTGSGYSSVV